MYEVVLRPLEVEEVTINKIDVIEKIGQKRGLDCPKVMARHKSDIKGHTSYLYFASLREGLEPFHRS